MKRIVIFISLIVLAGTCHGQQGPSWSRWSWLLGTWTGEGSGRPGQGEGTFTFALDLNNQILVRKAHSTYPAANGRPATVHDDLMIVYTPASGAPSRAIYFDNEGHTINYSISYGNDSIVLISEMMPKMPVFRLTYTLLDEKMVNTTFEVSMDGQNFKTYIEGKSVRTSQ